MKRFASLLLVCLPALAFAQESAPVIQPPSTLWGFLSMLLMLAAPMLGKWIVERKDAKLLQRAQLVHEFAEAAYWATNEAKALGKKVPDAVLYAQQEFLKAMKAAGLDASPGEISIAQFRWRAINGAAKSAVPAPSVARAEAKSF